MTSAALEKSTEILGEVMVHADPDDLGRGDNSQPGPPPVNGKASKAGLVDRTVLGGT